MRRMRRLLPWSVGCLSLATLAACGDDAVGGSGTEMGTTGPNNFTDTLPDSTSTGIDDPSTSGTTVVADGTGTTGDICETLLCDGVCCENVDDECVNDTCLPACPSEIRCGANQEICCDDGQVCLADVCATPTGPCTDAFDCEEGEFCEPTLDQCLPQPEPLDCEILPEFTDVEVALEWSYEQEEVVSMPAVADIDGDMEPEVVINTWNSTDPGGSNSVFFGHIVVLDGTNGQEQFRIVQDPANDEFGSWGRSTVGLADVDDDGLADIIYAGRPEVNIAPFANNSAILHAVNGLGQHIWASHAPDGSPHYIYAWHGAPVFANFDDDDASEIVFGTVVLDNDGTVLFDQDNEWNVGGGAFGSNGDYLGGISVVADLTGDGYPEIISGRQAWTVSWDNSGPGAPDVQLTLLWEYAGPDGFTAVADVDQDGDPEVILVGDPAPYGDPDGNGPEQRTGQVQILDGATGELWCGIDPTDAMCLGNPAMRTQPLALPGAPGILGGGRGGPPTVADFDGDGSPEIGFAGALRYAVYDLNRMGEDVVQPAGNPPAGPGEIYVRWESPTQDFTSNSTGSSVFDFQGDGPAEVIYGDECFVRVYDGSDGTVLFEEANPSATIHEYPIVVDVDDDGNSEMLVIANDFDWENLCGDIPGYQPRRGVFAYGDLNDQWVRTRQVWNSHSYHVTNSTSTGLTPTMEDNNWTDPDLNNYRQNSQGAGVFNAPDLEISLSIGLANCLQQEFEVIATVRNTGSIGIGAGVDVSLYRGTDTGGELVSTQQTTVGLLPGAATDISWLEMAAAQGQDYFAIVDDDDEAIVAECVEDNNEASASAVACPNPP